MSDKQKIPRSAVFLDIIFYNLVNVLFTHYSAEPFKQHKQ